MLKVLLVDDKPSVCSGLRRLIPWEQLGASVIGECGNGEEALELALKESADVVITDVRMPVMDGLELCKELHARMPDAVLIILSAFHEFSYAQSAIRFGVIDYILKPIDKAKMKQLADKISQIADSRKLRERYYKLLYDSGTKERLAEGLKRGEMEYFDEWIENVFQDAPSADPETVKPICLKLLALLNEASREIGLELEQAGIVSELWRQQLGKAGSTGQMKEEVGRIYRQAVQWVQVRKQARVDSVVECVKTIIQINYADPDLSMNSIANELNFSPNYLSVIFRQWTGETISSFITRLRLERSRQLLGDPAISIQDAARLVGYIDPHYFTKVFKKHEGLTPSQFRNMAIHRINRGSALP